MNFSQNFVVYGIRSNNFQQYPPRNIVTTRLTNQRNQTKNVRDQIEISFQFLSFSCSFWQKVDQIIYWRSSPIGLTPPLENPGSASDLNNLKSCIIYKSFFFIIFSRQWRLVLIRPKIFGL